MLVHEIRQSNRAREGRGLPQGVDQCCPVCTRKCTVFPLDPFRARRLYDVACRRTMPTLAPKRSR